MCAKLETRRTCSFDEQQVYTNMKNYSTAHDFILFICLTNMELFSDGSYITATGIYFEYFYKTFKDVGIDIITIVVVLMSGILSL